MNLDAKVSALINADPVPGTDSAPDKKAGAPPTGPASGAESAPGAATSAAPPGQQPASPPGAPTTLSDVLAEKLRKTREQRQAQRVLATAKETAAQSRARIEQAEAEAKADREAAAKERAELAAGKKDFRKFFEANGMSPAEAFKEMTRQAIEADTPEAKIAAMQEAWKAELAETVAPLKKTIEDLTEREKRAQESARQAGFENDFRSASARPEYEDLLDEYPGQQLLVHVEQMRDNPDAFYHHQERLKVRLTDAAKGYNMVDILNVLKAAQADHEAGKTTRRAARSGTPSDAAQPAALPTRTVNGTTAPRNAGESTIGNGLVTERAADGKFIPRGATAAARIRERVRRYGDG